MNNAQDLIHNTPDLRVREKASDIVTRLAAARELANNPEVVAKIRKYGKTPVIYVPTKGMAKPPATPGLMSFIEQATTVKEVENLLIRGKTEYKKASPGTIRRWEKAAGNRITELNKVVKVSPKKKHTPIPDSVEPKPTPSKPIKRLKKVVKSKTV
jgi:hypothetical protein